MKSVHPRQTSEGAPSIVTDTIFNRLLLQLLFQHQAHAHTDRQIVILYVDKDSLLLVERERESCTIMALSLCTARLFSTQVSHSRLFTSPITNSQPSSTGIALRLQHSTRQQQPLFSCGARRKQGGATKTQDKVIDDEDLRAGLNETVTEALKVMLAEDDKMLETFKDKVDFLGEFLVQDDQMEAARFMLILRGMLDHEVYPEYEELEEPYKKAFNTLWCLLEDSGWLLRQPGAEVLEADDDEEPGEPELEIRFS